MNVDRDVKIQTWPGLFWPCLWLFLIWGTLDSIKLELRAIRKGLIFPAEISTLENIFGISNEPQTTEQELEK